MTRRLLPALLLAGGCAWSNSLYQARVLSGNAATAEREFRVSEAQMLWGQVIVKADSAYARAPNGARGAEALWLSGHAAVASHDCTRAIPKLQGAMSAGVHAPWRQQVLLELAQCEETVDGPMAVALYAKVMATSHDPALLRRARIRQGHALVLGGEWQSALDLLAGEDTLPARLDRAMADAQLGRSSQLLVELALPLAAADTSVKWLPYLEALSAHHSAGADSLLDHLLTFKTITNERRASWLLASARDALEFDPAAADRRLSRLAAMPAGVSVTAGRVLQQELRLRRTSSVATLRRVVDSLTRAAQADDGSSGRAVASSLREARQLLDRNDRTVAGAPAGDLAMFGLAESARDVLRAPELGIWFFSRLETEWPRSPYVAKALMARAPLQGDSASALLSRLQQLPDNPYVAAAKGDVAGRVRVSRLEDSLSRFVDRMWTARPER